MAKRVVLAYSGGLDTSVAVRWMIDELGVEVIALCVDVGQAVRGLGRRAGAGSGRRRGRGDRRRRPTGVRRGLRGARPSRPTRCTKAAIRSCRRCRARSSSSTWWRPRASARSRRGRPRLYRQGERPGALRGVDESARAGPRRRGAGAGLGDDPRGVDPLRLPPRHPDQATKEKVYSIDDNLWGRAIECGEMEDPWARPAARRLVAHQADRHRAASTSSSASSRACRRRSTANGSGCST